ncbi:PBP1A family penicillin-binding protein [Sphingomonas parva]|uniref:PBP1A family penicillin-binding protein n=1 Tax=Sphingomonas parva TaxID=2555898 RepID=A0A4Y8ZQF1_9SPHN|nr:PBP1A family penicillin-binding protein [Sphingomonas parva]TFI58250.1 PBP1A family penicillin-binding protein [Sphingomonas parva]
MNFFLLSRLNQRAVRRWLGGTTGLAAALLLSAYAWIAFSPVLELDDPAVARPSLVLLTAQGEPFARRGDYREAPVAAGSLPARVTAPFVAIEDRRFYVHGGIDLRGTARAALANVRAGGVEQGGSTITQQLAKMAFVGSDRSFARKLKEATIALRLERHYSKDEILAAYLNRAYFGDGVYGIGAAARHYFGKDAAALELGEAAMLAGIVNAPSRLAPTLHLEAAQRRTRTVLAAMASAGMLAPGEAASVPLAQPLPALAPVSGAGWFADWVEPQVRGSLGAGTGRVDVPTTLDGRLQRQAEAAVAAVLKAGKSETRQAALIAMRPDGSVAAMVGGRDYGRSQFNRAVQAERQPGSAFKLFVYLAALRAGAEPEMLVEDRPLKVAGWSPKNFSNRYHGPITLTRAFADSSNVAAVRLSEQVGRDAVIQAAHDLGLRGEMKAVPSLALGASTTTLIDLTSAYAGVASGVYPIVPHGLASAPDGFAASMAPARAALSYHERAALLQLLSAAVETGTGKAARLPIPAFGKTGTTQNSRDAWFIGFAGDLIVGVWVGNDDETPMKGVTGGGAPARIWRAFMTEALGQEIAAEAARQAEEAARAAREAQEEEERWREEREERAPGWLDRVFGGRMRDWFS